MEIFLAENNYQDWLQVKYMKRQLEGDGTWKTDWTGQLKNLSPCKLIMHLFQRPIANHQPSKIARPGELWAGAPKIH